MWSVMILYFGGEQKRQNIACTFRTADGGIVDGCAAEHWSPYLQEPSYVSTVLLSVGRMDDLLVSYIGRARTVRPQAS